MLLVLGPCSAENYEQLYLTAEGLVGIKFDYFRAGLWKPRTMPGGFEGVGEKGIEWMQRIKKDFHYKISTEVASAKMAEKCILGGFDMLWVGARTTQNPFLVDEICEAIKGSNIAIMVKNPLNPDVNLWLGAIERFEKYSSKPVVAVHRGFSLSYNRYRQSPLWRVPLELKRLRQDLCIICDPSHIAGRSKYVKDISISAISTGFDGLMIEVHCNPSSAFTDSAQQLNISEIKALLCSLPKINNEDSGIDDKLFALREQIDDVDDEIVALLKERMEIAKKIAIIKKDSNQSVFQVKRWDNVIDQILKKAGEKDLNTHFVKELYEIIHQESIKIQNLIINKSNS